MSSRKRGLSALLLTLPTLSNAKTATKTVANHKVGGSLYVTRSATKASNMRRNVRPAPLRNICLPSVFSRLTEGASGLYQISRDRLRFAFQRERGRLPLREAGRES